MYILNSNLKSYIILKINDKAYTFREDIRIRKQEKNVIGVSEEGSFILDSILVFDTVNGKCVCIKGEDNILAFIKKNIVYIYNIAKRELSNDVMEYYEIFDGLDHRIMSFNIDKNGKVYVVLKIHLSNIDKALILDLERLERCEKILKEIICCTYIDIYSISKVFPIVQGKQGLKYHLLGKWCIEGISDIHYDINNLALLLNNRYKQYKGDIKYLAKSFNAPIGSKIEFYDIVEQPIILGKKKYKVMYLDVADYGSFFDENIKGGTLWDVLESVKKYLKEYPIVLENLIVKE